MTGLDISSWQPLSREDFSSLGMEDVAYIRAVKKGSETLYAVRAADGRDRALMASYDLAVAVVRQNGLEPLNVH